MNISRSGNVITVSTNTWFLQEPRMYDIYTQKAFKNARKSYGLRSNVFNSTHWIWKGGKWEYALNPSGHGVRFGISQDWSFQHFFDNNLPRYMLLKRFLRNHYISISRGPLERYPDVRELCRALRVHCSQETSPSYFANIRPVRPVGSFGPIWHPEITRMMRKAILNGFSIQESSHCDRHIWLSRTHSRTRNGMRISNEKELMNIYRAQFPGMTIFSNEPLSKSAKELSRACVVAGVHGGLMYKTLFAPEGAHVVEFAPKRSFYGIFWVISESARHRHHLVISDGSHADAHVACRMFSAMGGRAHCA